MNVLKTSKNLIQQDSMRIWQVLPKVKGLMAAQKDPLYPQVTTCYIHFWQF